MKTEKQRYKSYEEVALMVLVCAFKTHCKENVSPFKYVQCYLKFNLFQRNTKYSLLAYPEVLGNINRPRGAFGPSFITSA